MSDEQVAQPPQAARKAVKKAVRRTVKKAKKRAVKKPKVGSAPNTPLSKLDKLMEKSVKVYEGSIRKVEMLAANGADISSLEAARTNADGMKKAMTTTEELKKFLAESKAIKTALAKIQTAFASDIRTAVDGELSNLARMGIDVENVRSSVEALSGAIADPRTTAREIEGKLGQFNEIRMWARSELKRASQAEAEPETTAAVAVAVKTGDDEAAGIEAETAQGAEIAGVETEEAEKDIPEGEVAEEGVGEADIPPEEVAVSEPEAVPESVTPEKAPEAEAGPSPDELAFEKARQETAELVNEVYMHLQSKQAESGLPYKVAMDILDRASQAVESGALDTVGELRADVDEAIEAEEQLRKTVGLKLEKCRKDILAANQQGVNLGGVTTLFAEAREMFGANDFEGSGSATEKVEVEVTRIMEDFKDTVVRIGEVKGTITEARKKEIDVEEELKRFQSLKSYIADGDFTQAKEVLASINEAVINKSKDLLINEIRQTREILEKAPPYIDTTDPMNILDRAEEELGAGDIGLAALSVKESKDLAMAIRERYLRLVERSNEISEKLQGLQKAGLEIDSLIDMFSGAKDELKEGDFGSCEEHFEQTLKNIENTRENTYNELIASINSEMHSVQESLAELGRKYPARDISDLLDHNSEITVDYDESEDISGLFSVQRRLDRLRRTVEERDKELEVAVEREKREKVLNDFKERSDRCRMLVDELRQFEDVRREDGQVRSALDKARDGDIESALTDVDEVYTVLVEMKKELDMRIEVSLNGKGFERGAWGEAKVKVKNCGSFAMSDVSVRIEGPFEVRRRIHFKYMDPQEILGTSLAMKYSEIGRIPVDIHATFTVEPDRIDKERTFIGWIEVEKSPPYHIRMDYQSEERKTERIISGAEEELGTISEVAVKSREQKLSPLDICPVCKRTLAEADQRYLCGCNQMYHKRCAEKVNNNSCLTCGVALFEVENLIYLTCSVCRGDVWYDDEIFAHDCGEFYHRDCILAEGTCKNCYAPVDSTTDFLLSTCMVCHRIIKDDHDYRRCRCGEPYHSTCYRRISFCVRCGVDLKGRAVKPTMVPRGETVEKAEKETRPTLIPVKSAPAVLSAPVAAAGVGKKVKEVEVEEQTGGETEETAPVLSGVDGGTTEAGQDGVAGDEGGAGEKAETEEKEAELAKEKGGKDEQAEDMDLDTLLDDLGESL